MKYTDIRSLDELKSFLGHVAAADLWSDIQRDEWESACCYAGLEYSSFEYPEDVYAALESFVYSHQTNALESF